MKIKHLPYWLFYKINKNRDAFIICQSYVKEKYGVFKKNNWGDDLNKYLFEYVTKKKVINMPVDRLSFEIDEAYSLIGSILSFYGLDNKIIYGTGLMNPESSVVGKPRKIISVRGPKTREYLIGRGYDCPESYGDPALMLPLFYSPQFRKLGQGCIITNMGTSIEEMYGLKTFCAQYNLKLISLTNYNNWTDVIDSIVSSDFVISESLHGLIVAETYGIPNVWVELKNHPDYWNFKFYDYYESIQKKEKIIKLQNQSSLDEVFFKIQMWNKGKIDYQNLLNLFPFEIKCGINVDLLN